MSQKAQARKRSWTFALLAFCLCAFQINSAREVLLLPDSIAAALPYPALAQVVGHAIWGLLFAAAGFWSLRRAARDQRRLWSVLLLAFAGANAARWLLFTQADYERGRLPLLLLAAGGLLLIIIVFLRDQQDSHSKRKEV